MTATQPTFSLPTFEGPLDLLLHLIRENQVDIYDIPITLITRQYLEYLADWKARDLTIAGEYLVMAASLVEMKSRMLLPSPPAEAEEGDDPRAELVQRLLEYQRYSGCVETLREWEAFRRSLYFRGTVENPDDYVLPVSPGSLRGSDLVAALRRLMENAGIEEAAVSAIVPRRRVSLQMAMVAILRVLRRAPEGVRFSQVFDGPVPLAEVVLTFLAVLELLRRGTIQVRQRRPMGDFRLRLNFEGVPDAN